MSGFKILKSIFGGRTGAERRLAGHEPAGFSAPGLAGRFDKRTKKNPGGSNQFILSRTDEGNQAITDLRGGFDELAGEISDLRPDVKPGFGRLLRSRLEGLRNVASRTIGNLREELGRRRVLGSTFAQREIASQESEFGRQEDEIRAESFLQELQLTRELINDQFRASIGGALSVLQQLNFETGIGAKLGDSASRQLQDTNVARAEADAANSAGSAEFVATMIAIAAFLSDRRLKTNIRRIGTVNGYPWYEFDYIWGVHAQGVMSDEVPPAFVVRIHGYDAVNYYEVLR